MGEIIKQSANSFFPSTPSNKDVNEFFIDIHHHCCIHAEHYYTISYSTGCETYGRSIGLQLWSTMCLSLKLQIV